MKKSHRAGGQLERCKEEKKPVTETEETMLWTLDLLGDKTAQSLVNTIYFYIGKLYGLRPSEHRELRMSSFVIEECTITYRENVTKTYHGGLRDLKRKGRVVEHQCHSENGGNHKPCLVDMFKEYVSMIRELSKCDEAFYFRPSKTAYKFENSPLGIHTLNNILPTMMEKAGFKKKTAHCLRVTTASTLFQNKHEESLIRQRTGHVSSALFAYEKPEKKQLEKVSKCLGPPPLPSENASIASESNDMLPDFSDEEFDKIVREFDFSQIESEIKSDTKRNEQVDLLLANNSYHNCTINISFNQN